MKPKVLTHDCVVFIRNKRPFHDTVAAFFHGLFYDYLNIAFYIIFIIGVGIVFSSKSKNTSDYFRGVGVMPWWVTGASSWMASFSAWTLTGPAGKIYETGPHVLALYYSGIVPLLVVLFYTCYRFRRMRVVTQANDTLTRLSFIIESTFLHTYAV